MYLENLLKQPKFQKLHSLKIQNIKKQGQHHHKNSFYFKKTQSSSSQQSPNKKNSSIFHSHLNDSPDQKVGQISQQYHSFSTPQGNLIWSGATNIAFNQFKKQILCGKDLVFNGLSNQQSSTLRALNNSKFFSKNLNQEAFYVKSGRDLQTIKLINKQMKQKFPNNTTASLSEEEGDNCFFSYAYLFKALQYQNPFERQPGMLWFGQPQPGKQQKEPYMVEAFAAVDKKCFDQIKIIEFKNPYDFVLGFKAKPSLKKHLSQIHQQQITKSGSTDVIYVLSFNQRQTHQNQTVRSIVERIMEIQKTPIDSRKSNQNLEQFVMPVIDLEAKNEINQFKGLQIKNEKLKGERLKIIENIKLKMDQKGVVVEEDAFIGKDECAFVGSIEIIVNQPFWLVLTQEGHHPYFVAKINWLPQKIFKDQTNF